MAAAPHVAFLRGVNVGGKNALPMAQLRDLFAELGAANVRTYIQSGNVLFEAANAAVRTLPARASAAIAERFGLRVPVIVRSQASLQATVARNPFAASHDPAHLHLMLLSAPPDVARALDPDRSPGDRFALLGDDLYLLFPNGTANSKLTNAYVDRTLGVTSTTRNWRTILAVSR